MPDPCLPEPDANARLADIERLYRRNESGAARVQCEALASSLSASDLRNDEQVLLTQFWLVRIARRQAQVEDALGFAHRGLAMAIAVRHTHFQCRFHGQLARLLKDLGQGEEAAREAAAALELASSTGDQHGEAFALEALGSIHWIANECDQGLMVFQQLEELAKRCGDLDLHLFSLLGQASMRDVMANRALNGGQPEEAQAHCDKALERHAACHEAALALGDHYMLVFSEFNRGCTLQVAGRMEEATAVYERCLAQPGHDLVHGLAWMFLGGIAQKAGRHGEAVTLLQRSIDSPGVAAKPHSMLMALSALVDALESVGDLAAALACMRRFHALHVSNAAEKAQMRTRALALQYETEQAKAMAAQQMARAESLARNNEELSRASHEDALTGIANRRRFDTWVQATATHPNADLPRYIALLDIDHFKSVNDRYSHLVGDAVLQRVAVILSAACRRSDLAARYGGEEFALLIEDTSASGALGLCERVRAAVQDEPWQAIAPGLRLTISIGLAHEQEVGTDGSQAWVALADRRLYAAKHAGRNCVVTKGESPL